MSFGFIITRHVNNKETNRYWNTCIQCIHYFYSDNIKIVVIDDNSNKEFISADYVYKNVTHIQSEYKGRGELLPFYYFHKNKFFDNAVIIHDSVFIHKRVNFSRIKMNVLPLWHFDGEPKYDNVTRTLQLTRNLKNTHLIRPAISSKYGDKPISLSSSGNWRGCFGVQCYINHAFLNHIQNKYNIFNLLQTVTCRTDRCCLERIFGVIFYKESPNLNKFPSIFGSIMSYSRWGYSFNEYKNDVNSKNIKHPFVKVWTGR